MEIKQIKYIGEKTLSYVIGKCKATFALITHTHTAEEIGADAKGSASAALSLANEYSDAGLALKQDKNMIVNITKTTSEDGTVTYSADKTFEEIKVAINNGIDVFVKSNNVIYELLKLTNSNVQFASYTASSMLYQKIVIKSDDIVTYTAINVVASENIYGGVKASFKSDTDTVEAKIGEDGKLYVPEYPELTVDAEINSESENPVQNKVIKEYVDTTLSSLADGTTIVGEAGHAASADTATNAEHATSADSATNATNAEHAVMADSSTKSTQDAEGNVIVDTYETKTDAESKLAEAKSHADNAATTAATTVKNDLLNGAGEAYDTLKELGDLIDANQDALQALETVATGKANAVHTHETSDVNGLEDELGTINTTLANKSDIGHNHDELYYTQAQIDNLELITIEDIDTICGGITEGSVLENDVDELMAKLEG